MGGRIIGALERLGYENLAVRIIDGEVVVWCENRRVRYAPVWMFEALVIAAERVPPETRVRLIARQIARPVVEIAARADDVLAWYDGRRSSAAFRRELSIRFAADDDTAARENPSIRRFDLVLGPGRLPSQFGIPGSYVRMQVDASAVLTSALAPGLTGYGRAFIPLHNIGGTVSEDYRYSELRPGSVLLSYMRTSGSATFATVTAGMFELGSREFDRYGVVLDIRRYAPSGRLAIGGSVGWLGYVTYVINNAETRRRVWMLGNKPPEIGTYQVVATYRADGYDFTVTGRWGKFVAGDRGWRIDVARRFGELGVTIFGIKTDGRIGGDGLIDRFDDTSNTDDDDQAGSRVAEAGQLLGGVQVELPLVPRRRPMPERLRVTFPGTFTWSYRYRVGGVGVDVATGQQVEDLIAPYNPVLIGNNLDRIRRAIRAGAFREEQIRRGVRTGSGAVR